MLSKDHNKRYLPSSLNGVNMKTCLCPSSHIKCTLFNIRCKALISQHPQQRLNMRDVLLLNAVEYEDVAVMSQKEALFKVWGVL